MKRNSFKLVLILEAVLCLALCLFRDRLPQLFTTLLAFPLEQIGYGLRILSLSGRAGNILAIAVYITLSLSPLLLLLRKQHQIEDIFCGLISAYLFFALYCMINPGLLCQWVNSPLGTAFERAFLGGMFYSFALTYLILRLLRSFRNAERGQLLRYLQILLGALSILLVYLVFGSGFSGLLDAFRSLRETNQGNEHLLGVSYVFLALRYLVEYLPYLLDVGIIFAVHHLFRTERHSEEAIAAADRLSKRCIFTLIAVVLSHAAYQLLQLIFLKRVMQSWVNVSLPLFSLLFVLAVHLMAQYIRENKELKDDNDLFI